MRIVVVEQSGQYAAQRLDDNDAPVGTPQQLDIGALAEIERTEHPHWVWPDTTRIYPDLIRAGLRVRRVRDLGLIEATLLGYSGQWGQPHSLAAAWARERGEPVPEDHIVDDTTDAIQQPLFADTRDALPDPLTAAVAVHAAQRNRMRTPPSLTGFEPHPVGPRDLDLLTATDSAGALVAVEMRQAGLPWRGDIHDRLLTEALGERPRHGGRPPKLQALADEIAELLRAPGLNPDSPAALTQAFLRVGISIQSTRAHELQRIDHPAIPPLLEYKGLSRLYAANGWEWRETWVHDGRFRPDYLPAAVVSGRWATRGGGALQIPRGVRAAVVADAGWKLIVADARQLEPRVLAALSADAGMTAAAREEDMYAELATAAFDGDREKAKRGLLSAMYGGSSVALATLTTRYPDALALLERAARTGESGGVVRSVLGRTSPALRDTAGDVAEEVAIRRARDWGRFTRNFVIQASAADWAGVLLACLRTALLDHDSPAEIVFFQHDEVVVHAPEAAAQQAADVLTAATDDATRLVFGATPVRMPLAAAIVDSYADAK